MPFLNTLHWQQSGQPVLLGMSDRRQRERLISGQMDGFAAVTIEPGDLFGASGEAQLGAALDMAIDIGAGRIKNVGRRHDALDALERFQVSLVLSETKTTGHSEANWENFNSTPQQRKGRDH